MTKQSTGLKRRSLLLAMPALGLARAALAGPAVLRAGDQKGGTQSVMRAAGALDGLPYTLQWSQFAAAAPVLEALNAGAVDLAFAGDAPTTFALAAGLRARIIAPVQTTGAGTAILVPGASPVAGLAGLKGRTIATNRGSIGHALVLSVMQAQGWSAGDVTIANLLPSEAKAALASGAVDAWSSWGVYVAEAKLVDQARVVADGSHGVLTGLSYLIASDAAIAARRDAIMDFCRRLAVARRWALEHPDEYARVLAAEIGVSEKVAKLTFLTDSPFPVPIDAGVVAAEQKTADLYTANRIIHGRLDAATAFDASFNPSLSVKEPA